MSPGPGAGATTNRRRGTPRRRPTAERRTNRERTALDRLATFMGGTVEHKAGTRMIVRFTATTGLDVRMEGTTPALLARLSHHASIEGMELADIARVTGYVGPATFMGCTGPDEYRLRQLVRAGRELKGLTVFSC